jgi:hypothetical protein
MKNGDPTTVNSTFLSQGADFKKTGWWKVYSRWDLQNKKKILAIARDMKEWFQFFWPETMFWEKPVKSAKLPVVEPKSSL